MGHFLSDLDKSKAAVESLSKMFSSQGFTVRELEKAEQKNGDLEITKDGVKLNVEVKYDIMASRTGNLCFELSNGKRMTGVMETLADKIYYVVPGANQSKLVFVFNPTELREYIENSGNITIKNGGDKKKFSLALAKITKVVEDELPEQHFSIGG